MQIHFRCWLAAIGGLVLGWSQAAAQTYPQSGGQPQYAPAQSYQQYPQPRSQLSAQDGVWGEGYAHQQGSSANGRLPLNPPTHWPQRQTAPQGTGVVPQPTYPTGYATQPRYPQQAYPASAPAQRYPLGPAPGSPNGYGPGIPGQPVGYGRPQDVVLPPTPQAEPLLQRQPLPAPQQRLGGTQDIQVPGYSNQESVLNPSNGYEQGYGYPQGQYGDPYLGGMTGGYAGDVYGDTSACGDCGLADCMGDCCEPGCRPVWFGGVYGLIMARDYESNEYLSFYGGMPSQTVLSSQDAELGTLGGAEVAFGRHYCCGLGWQIGYWGLFPNEQVSTVYGWPDTRKYDLAYLNYMPGGYATNNGQYWYNQAYSHQVRRQNEFHNVEINLFSFLPLCPPQPCGDVCGDSCGTYGGDACGSCGSCEPCSCGPRCSFSLFGGFRYFYFDELFSYRSSMTGGYDYDTRDMFYDLDVDNHLFGFQWGGNFNYCLCRNLTLTGGTKLGVYANYMEHSQRIYGASGTVTVNSGPWAGTPYDYSSNKEDVAFMGEFNLGLAYQFACCWRVVAGYRAMGVSGVALAVNQMPDNYWNPNEIRYIDSDSQLILHGGYLGLEFVH